MQINTDQSEVSIWLVKLPKYISERILDSEELEIGTLQFIQKSQSPTVKFSLTKMPDLPQQYELKFIPIDKPLYLINNDKIEGKIVKECHISPVLNEEYFNFYKLRNHNKVSRTTQVIDFRDKTRISVTELESMARKRRKYLVEKKRERLDKNEVLDMIFKAFEKFDMWTVKDLADFTGQPTAYIQELVGEICNPHKKDYRNSYELKPEYKNN